MKHFTLRSVVALFGYVSFLAACTAAAQVGPVQPVLVLPTGNSEIPHIRPNFTNDYSVPVDVYVDSSGKVTSVVVTTSSGNVDVDGVAAAFVLFAVVGAGLYFGGIWLSGIGPGQSPQPSPSPTSSASRSPDPSPRAMLPSLADLLDEYPEASVEYERSVGPADGPVSGDSAIEETALGPLEFEEAVVIAAGLLLRGLHATYTIDPGFEYRNVALISLESAFDGYTAEEADARRRRLVTNLQALPAVDAVASSDHKPLGDDMSPTMMRLTGEHESQSRIGEITAVSEDYFSVLGLPIVRGRAFTAEEVRAAGLAAATDPAASGRPRPAILSETTARNLWPGSDPIGRLLVSAPAGNSPTGHKANNSQ